MGSTRLIWVCYVLLGSSLMSEDVFCDANEVKIRSYELQRGDFSLKLTNWGATLISFLLPDKHGKLADVVLGYESIDEYKNDKTYFGTIVGRVANRIGGAMFTLNGTHYKLARNEGNNTLHGGPKGFSDVIWTVKSYKKDGHITFTYRSFDGEEGFPGDVDVSVTYKFIETNKIVILMKAKSLNKPTPVNLASHSYWNLGGHESGSILSHELRIFSSEITPVDDKLIPTGKIVTVDHTPYDFRRYKKIGADIQKLRYGYDINYVLNEGKKKEWLIKGADVHEKVSGRRLELWTNKPGLQLYTSNNLGRVKGKDGIVYTKHAGLCLETQGFPDSVNIDKFPSQIVNPGTVYRHVMLFKFSAK